MAHSGRYVFQMDASSLVAPYDRRSARAPELASVSMTSSVQVPLTEKMTALVAGAPAISSRWFLSVCTAFTSIFSRATYRCAAPAHIYSYYTCIGCAHPVQVLPEVAVVPFSCIVRTWPS